MPKPAVDRGRTRLLIDDVRRFGDRKAAAIAILPALLAVPLSHAWAQPPADDAVRAGDYALGYFLPRGKAGASYSQRLVQCPTADNDFQIVVESRAQIKAVVVPDYTRLYRIDGRAGFLAKRSTELSLNPDGTIKTVNATAEGQGGAVLVATAKLAAFAVSTVIGRGGPPKGGFVEEDQRIARTKCRKEIAALLVQRDSAADVIASLEAKLAASGLTSREADELTFQRTRLAALDDALTLSSDPVVVDERTMGPIAVPPLDYEQWFAAMETADIAALPADAGILVSWKVNEKARDALREAAVVKVDDEKYLSKSPEPVVYYRRPVPVSVAVTPCTNSRDPSRIGTGRQQEPVATCVTDRSVDAAPLSTDAPGTFPQLSGLFRLRVGRGGLFGSRTIGLEFDASGAPVTLKYGSDPGAADIASAIDAARDAGTTIRDAKKDALAREAAILQSRKDIRDLEGALEK